MKIRFFIRDCLLVFFLVGFTGLGLLLANSTLSSTSLTFTSGLQLFTSAHAMDATTGASKTTRPYDAARLAMVASQFGESEAAQSESYKQRIAQTLKEDLPVLRLEGLKGRAELAQRLILTDGRLKPFLFFKSANGEAKALRNEVMSVALALPGDRVGAASACGVGQCYRVDIYNFFHNVTITGIVDVENNAVIVVNSLPETQPDLSKRLEDLAVAIAKNEPAVRYEVARYLRFKGKETKPESLMPVMVSTKSALKNSLCERSKHLCVAPTYVLGDQALWVIVDLTDMKVAGLRWTTVGESQAPVVVTQRLLENEYVYKNYCEKITQVERNGWKFDYHLTSSDGLRVAGARFNDKIVFESAKVVDWHVSYSREDGFGYSDATGCPMFSSAVVVAYDAPMLSPIIEEGAEVGFSISQDFRQLPWPEPCHYRYEERHEFYNDGRYRVAMTNFGRGCGEGGTYRPVLRIELGKPSASQAYNVERWQSKQWQSIDQEQWSVQPDQQALGDGKYSHRFVDDSGDGYMLMPSFGQFADGSRGDNAFIYITIDHPEKDEGDRDLVTLGSCCNSDYQQGPEQFMQPPEPFNDQGIVLWYVPQMKNDGRKGQKYCWAETVVEDGKQETQTWPCTAGPMIVPTNLLEAGR